MLQESLGVGVNIGSRQEQNYGLVKNYQSMDSNRYNCLLSMLRHHVQLSVLKLASVWSYTAGYVSKQRLSTIIIEMWTLKISRVYYKIM